MIYLTMTPEVSSVCAYDQPDGYENRLPYLAIVTVSHLTDTIVYLHDAVGKVDRETWQKTLGMLRDWHHHCDARAARQDENADFVGVP